MRLHQWREHRCVGFARALVVDPDILLLDEPFSSLDVLTAETLRGDLLDLWDAQRIPTKGMVIVSHNIEEAVEIADRILIFSSDPGRIRAGLQRFISPVTNPAWSPAKSCRSTVG